MRKLFAYCFAVVVAALCVLAPVHLRQAPTLADVPFLSLELFVASVVTGAIALPPFLVVVMVAKANRLNSVLFYLACGVAFSLAVDVAVATYAAASLPVGDPERLAFSDGFIRFLPSFLSAGGLGSLCYWMLAGRLPPPLKGQ
jgi:hypothetical protein